MNKYDALKILNLDENASFKEINDAYIVLKKLYSDKDNIITMSIEEEFLSDKRETILDELNNAYKYLIELNNQEVEAENDKLKRDINVISETVDSLNGKTIRNIREKNNIDLEEIALATNIKKQYLYDIENEAFSELPPRVFIKGYLKELSSYLNFNEKLIDDYLELYDNWLANKD